MLPNDSDNRGGPAPEAIVTGDLHIGCRYFMAGKFAGFMDSLAPDTALILNGDVVDRRHTPLQETHRKVLDRIKAESEQREVIWIRGNHDEVYVMDDLARIRFAPCHNLGKRLFIAHGAHFDNVLPYNRPFVLAFRAFHRLRILLGADSVHVAFYAKKWMPLYRVLRRSVALNAVEYARENGYEAVTCGHTHYPEETVIKGVKYFNTGAWTEEPVSYLAVYPDHMQLEQLPRT
ncbi:MAG: metallophosphoesterase [Kiritimatiellia bacterium]